MTTSARHPSDVAGVVHEANGGLHNAALALQLLAKASPDSVPPAERPALLESGMRGIRVAKQALATLAAALPR